jgi:hypothetical protein
VKWQRGKLLCSRRCILFSSLKPIKKQFLKISICFSTFITILNPLFAFRDFVELLSRQSSLDVLLPHQAEMSYIAPLNWKSTTIYINIHLGSGPTSTMSLPITLSSNGTPGSNLISGRYSAAHQDCYNQQCIGVIQYHVQEELHQSY